MSETHAIYRDVRAARLYISRGHTHFVFLSFWFSKLLKAGAVQYRLFLFGYRVAVPGIKAIVTIQPSLPCLQTDGLTSG